MKVDLIPVEKEGKNFSVVNPGDVVILPAFGAAVQEMLTLKEKQVQIVDTTCPWVSKVINRFRVFAIIDNCTCPGNFESCIEFVTVLGMEYC